MKAQFLSYIFSNHLFSNSDRLILAVSGGIDSVAMLNLIRESGFKNAVVAHCNFNLRGKESDADEELVRSYSEKSGFKCVVKNFETQKHASNHNLSIQMAARDLRYKFFKELAEKERADKILIAHNRDDSVETFFINLIRGTGVHGLTGIQNRHENNRIVRPLLFASRKEIISYAKEKKLTFREDSSNAQDKYLRNYIRHHIIPEFRHLNASFDLTMERNFEKIKEASRVMDGYTDSIKKQYFIKEGDQWKIPIEVLQKSIAPSSLLWSFLKDYGFSSDIIQDIWNRSGYQSGKWFQGKGFRLICDREYLFLIKEKKDHLPDHFFILENTTAITLPFSMKFERYEEKNIPSIVKDPKIACIDEERLEYPLVLRKWRDGDSFQPFGMQGRKKVSDFLIDLKVPLHEKENTWVIQSGEEIVWVVGLRISEWSRITHSTHQAVFISV